MNREISVVDYHHEVLTAWAALRKKLSFPPAVWTLDYHTDTMPSFRGAMPPPLPGAWADENTVADAVRTLRHDEHFDWALRAGIISEAFIGICGDDNQITAHEAMHVVRPADFPGSDVILNSPEKFRPQAEQMLSSSFLAALFPRLPAENEIYILDIDCDYILCRNALYPADDRLIQQLVQNAALITLSRENDWVKILKLPGETITGTEVASIIATWR